MTDGSTASTVEARRHSDAVLTARLLSFCAHPPRLLTLLLLVSAAGTACFLAAIAYTVTTGIGTWGNNIPVGWAFGITSFVWWIGIGHAGTFISAILLLLRQRWRTSINRLAEAMTLFALANAGLFPLLHLGRPWFFYWLIPYPSQMQVWPQFRSALTWDIGAVLTYATISVLFWYLGLLPDLAAARDHLVGTTRRRIYGVLALGWRGTQAQWRLHARAQLLLAGLATPLVVSVHSVVSLDFATALLPGWHSTIFPPYFVAGALFSGFAMLLTILVPLRWAYGLEDIVTPKHLDAIAKLVLALSLVLAYSYGVEHYLAMLEPEGSIERDFVLTLRPFGPYATLFWLMLACNIAVPQVLWFRRARRSPRALLAVSILVNVGMWLERFVIIVGSLSRDFLPSTWTQFHPSVIDAALLGGSFAFFALLFLLFLRFVPFIPLQELKAEAGRG